MKVLLLGEGATLHAFAWSIVSEPAVTQVHCVPGNAGTALLVGRPPVSPAQPAELAQWAFSQQIDLVVVQGRPEWVETLSGLGLAVIGAGERGWQALRSRQAGRALLRSHGCAVVESQSFRDLPAAERYLAGRRLPVCLRLDDAAQPEAVRVVERYEAFQQLERLFSLDPQSGVCIEDEVPGLEVLLVLLSDGQRVTSWGLSRPYDRRYEGDTGPATVGMGAYAPYGDAALEESLLAQAGRPAVAALRAAGLLRPAFLALRIILGPAGPVVRELAWDMPPLHAVVTLPRWRGSLAKTLHWAAQRCLEETPPVWEPAIAVAVAMVLDGYADSAAGGPLLPRLYEGRVLAFQHATQLREPPTGGGWPAWLRPAAASTVESPWRVAAAGEMVLLVVGCAPSAAAARRQAYEGVEELRFERGAWRRDIAAELS